MDIIKYMYNQSDSVQLIVLMKDDIAAHEASKVSAYTPAPGATALLMGSLCPPCSGRMKPLLACAAAAGSKAIRSNWRFLSSVS